MRKTLPKYWYINITREGSEIIKNWIKVTYPDYDWRFGLDNYGIFPDVRFTGYNFSSYLHAKDFAGGTEITFEEFEKFILNKTMEKTIKLSLDQAISMYGKSKEMDELLLANFSKEELTNKLPASWKGLNPTFFNGYVIDGRKPSNIRVSSSPITGLNDSYKPVFATEKQAKSALAMAQLSHLLKAYNGDWEPDWSSSAMPKCCICCGSNKIHYHTYFNYYTFLAFKTAKLRDEFLKNFEGLIKQYFMID
jgi:hypothetical protein